MKNLIAWLVQSFLGRWLTSAATASTRPRPVLPGVAPPAASQAGVSAAPECQAEIEAIGGRKRLLVCAAEPEHRRKVEGLLRSAGPKWSAVPTTKSGAELVDLVRAQQAHGVIFHAVAEDPALGDTLQRMNRELPGVQRVVLGTDAVRDTLRALPGMPPAVLRPDVTAGNLNERLTHAFLIERWLLRPELRALLPQIRLLPVLSGSYQRILESLADSEFDAEKVATLVMRDAALTAQLLKVVNSAYFGRSGTVDSALQAVLVVGAARLKAVVLANRAFRFVDEESCRGLSPQAELDHALAVARAAQDCGLRHGESAEVRELLFTAAMLHDLGKLLLLANLSDRYQRLLQESRNRETSLWTAERQEFGISHAELGAFMLGVWGLPLPIVEAVAYHHEPAQAPSAGLTPLGYVHWADCRVRGRTPDRAFLESRGLALGLSTQ
jgi:HD-like signal output (HDOD) protein